MTIATRWNNAWKEDARKERSKGKKVAYTSVSKEDAIGSTDIFDTTNLMHFQTDAGGSGVPGKVTRGLIGMGHGSMIKWASAPGPKFGGHGADARSFVARRATAGILSDDLISSLGIPLVTS